MGSAPPAPLLMGWKKTLEKNCRKYFQKKFHAIAFVYMALSRDPCKIMQDGLESLALTRLQAFFQKSYYKR